jgi:hypothetical protein
MPSEVESSWEEKAHLPPGSTRSGRVRGRTSPGRPGLVALAVLGYAGLVGVALLRTTSGLAPVELLDASALGYLLAAAFLAVPTVAAATVTTNHRRTPSPRD